MNGFLVSPVRLQALRSVANIGGGSWSVELEQLATGSYEMQ